MNRKTALGVFLASVLAAIVPTTGLAEPPSLEGNDPFDADPIGLGTTRDLEKVPKYVPPTKPPTPREGEILTALPATKELSFENSIEFKRDGTVLSRQTTTLRNPGRYKDRPTYRFTVPSNSVVTKAESCAKGPRDDEWQCTDALNSIEHAGGTVRILGRTLIAGGQLRLRLHSATAFAVRDGQVRYAQPARGNDTRAKQTRLRVHAPFLAELDVEGSSGEVLLDPWLTATIRGRLTAPLRSRTLFPCGKSTCARIFVANPKAPPIGKARISLLLDASPSTQGIVRSRVPQTLAALLARAPTDSTLHAVAFGAVAKDVFASARPVSEVSLETLVNAFESDLGSGTSLKAAYRSARRVRWRGPGPKRIVIVGDARYYGERDAEVLRNMGAPVFLLSTAQERPTDSILRALRATGGDWIMVANEADLAARGTIAPLSNRIAAVFAQPAARWLGNNGRMTRRGQSHVWLGPSHQAPRIHAAVRKNTNADLRALERRAPDVTTLGKGVPGETVLGMLRDRVVPVARRCFRRDRRGRLDYSVRATFEFRLRYREVVASSVQGRLPNRLRQCLEDAVYTLDVPEFTGEVVVRYPVHTARAPKPVEIKLNASTNQLVDDIIGQ